MTDIRCGSCAYWQKPEAKSYGFRGDHATGAGQCRRNPPTPLLTEKGLRAYWPLTAEFHWCGNHAVMAEPDVSHETTR